jgi:hypothetical protein
MALLSKKEKMELATLIANAVVTALKENSTNSQPSAEGRKSANEGTSSRTEKNGSSKKSTTSKKETTAKAVETSSSTKKKLTIKDFEPKAQGTNYNWKSYCSNRTNYCYFVATNGAITDGKIFGTKFYQKEWSEEFATAYAKAKADFMKQYPYIKKEDR